MAGLLPFIAARAACVAFLLGCGWPRLAAGLRVAKLGLECHTSSGNLSAAASQLYSRALAQKPKFPACDGWREQASRLLSTELLPFNGSLWSRDQIARYPLTRESLRSAAAPVGYLGARSRWVDWTLRLLQGEPIEIAVLGGSMPGGAHLDQTERYSEQLEKHFHEAGFPNVGVKNRALLSTCSEAVLTSTNLFNIKLRNASMVIVDYGINDWMYTHGQLGKPHGAMESYDELLQYLIELPHSPVVIEFGSTNYVFQQFKPTMDCTKDLTQFVHARAERFQVPIVSLGDSICQSGGEWWFGHQHPNATTHDLIARMFLGVIGSEVERACSKSARPVVDHPKLPPLRERPYSECFRKRSLRCYDFRSGQNERFTLSSGFIEGVPEGGWHWGRDVASKPYGWLVGDNFNIALHVGNPYYERNLISLGVRLSEGGWIRLDYLSTYGDMGALTCWLEGMSPQEGCLIDGLATMNFSEEKSAFMRVVGGTSTTLHCHASGGKFKLLGFASC